MSSRGRILGPVLIAGGTLTTLFLHAYLGSYSRFIADDYCSAGMARRFGILRAVWYWYLNWTGRYTASTLDAFFGLLGPGVTPFVPAGVLIVWLCVLAYTISLLLREQGKKRYVYSLVLAAVLLYLTLILSPNVRQSLYWGQGMRAVVPPLILSAVYLALFLLFKGKQWPATQYALWLIMDFMIVFLLGGFNETFTALQVSAFAISLLLAWAAGSRRFGHREIYFLLAGGAGALLALIIVVAAPGNGFRQAFSPAPPGPIGILKISSASFGIFLARTFGSWEKLTAIFGGAGLAVFLGLQMESRGQAVWIAPLTLLGGMVFTFLCFPPAAYGFSEAPPDRTLIIAAHILSVTIILAGLMIGNIMAERIPKIAQATALNGGLLLLAALLFLTSVVNSDRQLLISRQLFMDYASQWDDMNGQIIKARELGEDQVNIPTKVNWAELNEPNDNPKFWVNVCYRQYYGIRVLDLNP